MTEGQVTKLSKANDSSNSLRTTVPAGIVKQFGLKDGSKISWVLDVDDGEIVIKLKPIR
jgi:antitoxin component of MazEF toxin-antitoxin module